MNTFLYGQKTIVYSLEHVARKTLAITVQPDMAVHVRAPLTSDTNAIERILRKRAAWILRQQRFFSQFHPKTTFRRYISGETHLYLGRQYRLRIREADTEDVKLIAGYIYIYTQNTFDTDYVKALLYRWYATHARTKVAERFHTYLPLVSSWKLPTPQLCLRHMRNRWGNCNPSGIITLNLDLIRAPRACIDYVILHELCHLRYPHHRSEFYDLLSTLMSDWRVRKMQLEAMLS